jgi:hypothetical protein
VSVHSLTETQLRGQAALDKAKADGRATGLAEGIEQGKLEKFAELTSTHLSELGRVGKAHSTEMARAEHRAEAHGFWRGSALALLVGLAIGGYGTFSAVQSGWFGLVAADSARRPATPLELHALPEDSQPLDPLPGYRRGHEPADAP